jgi:hypothetical protein
MTMTKHKKIKVENPVDPKLKISDANFSPDGLKRRIFSERKKERFF